MIDDCIVFFLFISKKNLFNIFDTNHVGYLFLAEFFDLDIRINESKEEEYGRSNSISLSYIHSSFLINRIDLFKKSKLKK